MTIASMGVILYRPNPRRCWPLTASLALPRTSQELHSPKTGSRDCACMRGR